MGTIVSVFTLFKLIFFLVRFFCRITMRFQVAVFVVFVAVLALATIGEAKDAMQRMLRMQRVRRSYCKGGWRGHCQRGVMIGCGRNGKRWRQCGHGDWRYCYPRSPVRGPNIDGYDKCKTDDDCLKLRTGDRRCQTPTWIYCYG